MNIKKIKKYLVTILASRDFSLNENREASVVLCKKSNLWEVYTSDRGHKFVEHFTSEDDAYEYLFDTYFYKYSKILNRVCNFISHTKKHL